MGLKPGYKQTEVGVIPEDWNLRELGDVFTLKSGFAFSSDFFSNTGPIVLTPGNFQVRGGLYFEERNTKRYSGSYDSSMTFNRGDLLIVMTDLTPDCNLLGKPAFVTTDDVILHNQRIGKVVFKGKSADANYLFYVLLSRDYLDRIKGMATGSTVRHTSNKSIYGVPVRLPSLPEQRAISGALGDVDALLGALEKLIAKKRDLKQAAMQQLLTGQKRLPGFSGEWENVSAHAIGFFRGGNGFPLEAQGETTGTYPFFKVSDMNNEGNATFMTNATHWISETTRKRLGATAFPTNSIVFAKVGAAIFLERKKILGQRSCIDNNMAAFVLDNRRADVRFVHTLLLSKKLGALVATTALPALNGKQLGEMEFALPTLAEQTAIAEVLSDMDAEITALEQRLAKTRALKQGMMQELLTGKTRLVVADGTTEG